MSKHSYQLMCCKDDYCIYALLEPAAVNLRVISAVSSTQTRQFDMRMTSLSRYTRIQEYCGSFQNLLEIIKDSCNIMFDSREQKLLIYQRNRFGRMFNIQSINFKQAEKKIQQGQFAEILVENFIPKFSSEKDLSGIQIKEIFGFLSECILKIHKQSHKTHQKDEQKFDQQYTVDEHKQVNISEDGNEICKLKEQLIRVEEQIKQIKERLTQLREKQSHHKQINDSVMTIINRIQQKIGVSYEKIDEKIQKTYKRLQFSQNFFVNFYDSFWPVKAEDFIDSNCLHFKSLQLHRNKVTNTTECVGRQWAHVYSKIVITEKKCYFAFKFDRIERLCSIGIISNQYMRGQKIGEKYITYHFNGRCDVEPNRQYGQMTKGFKVGEIVELIVNVKIGSIEWKANGETRNKIEGLPLLKNGYTKWLPFVYLHNKNDSFRIY